MILLARFWPTLAKYQQNLFAISSESVIVTPCSCINEILRGLHFLRFIAKFRIFHVALIALLFLTSRASQCCFLAILNNRVSLFLHVLYVFSLSFERDLRCFLYSLFFWLNDFNNPLEIQGFVMFYSTLFLFMLLKGKQVSKIPIFFQ